MKQKTKLIATLTAMCLVITLGVFGILAVKTLNMSVGGNITFNAEGLDFIVSDGSFETTAGAVYPGVNGDSTKLKGFAMNTNTKESSIATQKASWTGLNLTMSSLGDVVLVFTVTNNMAENLVVTITPTITGTNINSNMEIQATGGTVVKGTPSKMKITFHIKDTSINAGLTGTNYSGFSIAVNFAKEIGGATANNPLDEKDAPTLTFSSISDTEASVVNNGATGDIVLPSYVKINNVTYSISKIGDNAFANSSISSIIIPDTVTEIGRSAFYGCANLKEIIIPGAVKYIRFAAFFNSGLENVVLEEGVEKIESKTFEGTKISTIKIPKSLTQIAGFGAFDNCPNLKTVYADCGVDVLLGEMGSCIFNNTEFVYIHKDVAVSNSAFTKVGQEGDYYKYTETITHVYET